MEHINRQHPIFIYSDWFIRQLCHLDPMRGTEIGMVEYNSQWTDESLLGIQKRKQFLYECLQQIRNISENTSCSDCPWVRHAITVLQDVVEGNLSRINREEYFYANNIMNNIILRLMHCLDLMPSETPKNIQDIVTRLENIHEPLQQMATLLSQGSGQGKSVSKRQVLAVIKQGEEIIVTFGNKFNWVEKINPATWKSLKDHVETSIQDFIDFLWLEYLPSAPLEEPVGEIRYRWLAEQSIGSKNFDLEEIYLSGFDRINEISEQITDYYNEIFGGSDLITLPEMAADLRIRGGKVNTKESFFEIQERMQQLGVETMRPAFPPIPKLVTRIQIKENPIPFIGEEYIPASDSLSRPGKIYHYWVWPGDGGEPLPLFNEITTAFHEGFPGHAYQLTWTTYNHDSRLSMVNRSIYGYSFFSEGWALYAEELMAELGVYSDFEGDNGHVYYLGHLFMQLLRACRIVIDIGFHLQFDIPDDFTLFHPGERWTYELGVEMLSTGLLGMEKIHARSEMTRYAGSPGQAISYLIGYDTIMDLRDEVWNDEDLESDLESLVQFHQTILQWGSVGQDYLLELWKNRDSFQKSCQCPSDYYII